MLNLPEEPASGDLEEETVNLLTEETDVPDPQSADAGVNEGFGGEAVESIVDTEAEDVQTLSDERFSLEDLTLSKDAGDSDELSLKSPTSPETLAARLPQSPSLEMPDLSQMMDNPVQMQLLQMQQMMLMMQQQMAMLQNQAVQGPIPLSEKPENEVREELEVSEPPASVNVDQFSQLSSVTQSSKAWSEKVNLRAEQQVWLDHFVEKFQAKTEESKEIAQKYRGILADPSTAINFQEVWKEIVYPIVTKRSKGARIWDVDNNEYVDVSMGFGVNFFGHSPDFVEVAIKEQLEKGMEIGNHTQLAGDVAKIVCNVTGMERVSLCNTGPEALALAIGITKTITGRDKVVYFAGNYQDTVPNVLLLEFGTEASLEFIEKHKNEIAAVVIEPSQDHFLENQPEKFVKQLREITISAEIALVFDEANTGFRVHQSGMQKEYGVKPDIVCYGKIIGGGFPLGVVAGSARYMNVIDGGYWEYGDDSAPEVNPIYNVKPTTISPIALTAAKSVLAHLVERGPELQEWMNERTKKFAKELNEFFEWQTAPIRINQYGSWFKVETPAGSIHSDLIMYSLLEKGVYVSVSEQNCFFSSAHTENDIEIVKQAFIETVYDLQKGGFLPAGPNSSLPFPLTEAQREIWLATQISEKASTAHNEGFSISLSGELDVDALKEAVQKVAMRHTSLNLRFDLDGESQAAEIDQEIKVDFIDLSAGEYKDPKAAFGTKIDTLMTTPFDLNNGPLFRAAIAKIAPENHAILWVANHIVCDGWSAAIIIDEIRSLYNASVIGEEVTLPVVNTMREYVDWEHNLLAADEGSVFLDYWVEKFTDLPNPIELPTDYSRPVMRSYSGSSVHFVIDGELFGKLQHIATQQETSSFIVTLAAFKAMLYKLSGYNDLVVGIQSAGQEVSGLSNLVGHAAGILPIRSKLEESSTFNGLVQQVKEAVLEAEENRPFTFSKLLNSLSIPTNPSRLPLVEVVFNLNEKTTKGEFYGLTQVIREIPKQATSWDIFVNFYEEDGALKIDFDYSTDLFKRETIQVWLENFSLMLQYLSLDSDTTLAELSFFPDNGLDEKLIEWNMTDKSYPTDLTVVDLISRQSAQSPFKPAVIDQGRAHSYRDIDLRVNMLSRYFQTIGVSRGMLIGLCMERSVDMLVSALAIMRSGAAFVPLDPNYPHDRLLYMIEDSGMALLLTKSSFVDNLPSSIRLIVLDEEEPGISRETNVPVQIVAKPDDIAYMIYTSGTSGRPKGVPVTHKSLVNFLLSMQEKPGIAADDVMINVTTISFDMAFLELYLPLISGARLSVASPEISIDGSKLAAMLDDVEATIMQATPTIWKLLLEAGWSGREGLKMLCGGESLPRALADELLQKGSELWNMYGPTETTIWSTLSKVESGDHAISIGKPIANTQVYILNGQLRPVPIGVDGVLFIGGDGVAKGYHKQAELTQSQFIDNPFGLGKLYNTGDIAKFDEYGNIYFLGRADDQVKLRGYRIELREIEQAISSEPDVQDAVVVVHEFNQEDERLIAYIKADGELDLTILRSSLIEKLPFYMIPSSFMTLESFPLTPNGKIDRLSLPVPSGSRSLAKGEIAQPTDSVEEQILEIWSSVLKIDQSSLGIHDDFFELGGHPFLAKRVISQIHDRFGNELSLFEFFKNSTVAGLAGKTRAVETEEHGANGHHPQRNKSKGKTGSDVEEFVI
ncbi:MAG: amino acid adenylation domain-containing protein [Chloroflexota bacterium]